MKYEASKTIKIGNLHYFDGVYLISVIREMWEDNILKEDIGNINYEEGQLIIDAGELNFIFNCKLEF